MPKIKPASAQRIAEEIGGAVLDEYRNKGLTCYRTERTLPSGQIMVEEGYIKRTLLPNGKLLVQRKKHKEVTRAKAEDER